MLLLRDCRYVVTPTEDGDVKVLEGVGPFDYLLSVQFRPLRRFVQLLKSIKRGFI